MDDTPASRLEAIDRRLASIEAVLTPMADAFAKFWPMIERRLDNPAARWKGRRQPPVAPPGQVLEDV